MSVAAVEPVRQWTQTESREKTELVGIDKSEDIILGAGTIIRKRRKLAIANVREVRLDGVVPTIDEGSKPRGVPGSCRCMVVKVTVMKLS